MSDNFVSLFAGEQSQGIRFKDNSPLTFVGASTRSTGKVGHFNISADGSVAVRKNTSATEALDVNGNALISGNVTVRNDSPNIVVSSSNLNKNFKIGGSFSNTPVFTIRNQSDEQLLALDGETLSIQGTVDESNIPNLDASKVTTGMFNTDQIPELSADKITSGKLNSDRIPDLDASKIATGTFDTDRIPDLDADKITSGELNQNQIPELDIAKVSGLQEKLDDIQPSNWKKSNDDIYNSNNGNVGIGRTDPAHQLEINGNCAVGARTPSGGADPSESIIGRPGTDGTFFQNTSHIRFKREGKIVILPITDDFDNRNNQFSSIEFYQGGSSNKVLNKDNSYVNFKPEKAMTITSLMLTNAPGIKNGLIGMGKSNPTFKLHLPDSTDNTIGRARANKWETYSDIRVKSCIENVHYGIEDVMKLKPRKYFHHNTIQAEDGCVEWIQGCCPKDEPKFLGEETIGLVAQEVYEVIPELVSADEEPSELWGMDYN